MVSFEASADEPWVPVKESLEAAELLLVRAATVVASWRMDSECASMATWRRGQRVMLRPLR